MRHTLLLPRAVAAAVLAAITFTTVGSPVVAQPKSATQLVLLGTGTPRPEPSRSGPATAVVVNDAAYLVDFGPGVVRRAVEAFDNGIKALAVDKLDIAFVTHLHSDHTVGYPDVIFTPWVQGRNVPLRVYGPKGIAAMTEHVLLAWREDIEIRTKGLEQRDPAGARVDVHEIASGIVYKDRNVTVTAFDAMHGAWPQAFGFRFDSADRSICISGDTSPSPALARACANVDILMHEVYSEAYVPALMPNWTTYRSKYHTTTTELAAMATTIKPGLLILYHRGAGRIPDEQYLSEIRRGYAGRVVIGRDLDVY